MDSFNLFIAAPYKPLIQFQAVSVSVPGIAGYIGARTGRTPLLVALKTGLVHIIEPDQNENWFAITGGFFEMLEDEATILADKLIPPEEAQIASHLTGRLLTFPPQFASEIQKADLASALLYRKLHGETDA